MSDNEHKQSLLPVWAQSALAAAFVSVLVGAWFADRIEKMVMGSMESRPPVVVVDVGALAAGEVRNGANSADELMKALDRTTMLIESFRDEGYVVLDSRYVLEAPKDIYLANIVKSMQKDEAKAKEVKESGSESE